MGNKLSLVDGGYLSWVYGTSEERIAHWPQNKGLYSKQQGKVIIIDGPVNSRTNYDPNYKSRRADKRANDPDWMIRTKNVIYFRENIIKTDPHLQCEGIHDLEADDLIALLGWNIPGLLVHGVDKDLLQIPEVQLQRLDGVRLTIQDFASKIQKTLANLITTPERVVLYLALNGDKSDSVERLVPPRRLDIFQDIMTHPQPFTRAYEHFGSQFLHNLYLVILPGPWCFKDLPSPGYVAYLLENGGLSHYIQMQPLREDVLELVNKLLAI